MSKLKIGSRDWVVICDGRKALILQNEGDEEFPNLRMREVREHDDASTHSQGADAPGRVHQSFDGDAYFSPLDASQWQATQRVATQTSSSGLMFDIVELNRIR